MPFLESYHELITSKNLDKTYTKDYSYIYNKTE